MECVKPFYIKKHMCSVPCGTCGNCLKRNIDDWVIRCENEMKDSLCGYFVTLTYAKDPLQLYKKDLQNFFKRVRVAGGKFSYFAVGDYGDTFGRPHYHALLFVKNHEFPERYLENLWKAGEDVRERGFVQVKPLKWGSIKYVVKYGMLAKIDWDREDKRQKPFFLMSKRPAIGSNYLTNKRTDWHVSGQVRYYPNGAYKQALPRYYRDKIFRKNKALAELEKEKYLREQIQRRDDVMQRQKKNLNQEPYLTYYERLINKSQKFLDELRTQKKQKNKSI